jgi:hypothetical protein
MSEVVLLPSHPRSLSRSRSPSLSLTHSLLIFVGIFLSLVLPACAIHPIRAGLPLSLP